MKMRPFQLILLAIFGFAAAAGLFFLITFQGSSDEEIQVYGTNISVWGTLDRSAFQRVKFEHVESVNEVLSDALRYTQLDPRTFDQELTEAIAEGRGPDMVIITNEQLVKHRAKLWPIQETTYPVRDFKNAYVDGAEVFLLSDGLYGIPFAVDPLVMYWNRDTFSSRGLSQAPTTWEEVLTTTVPALAIVEDNLDITKSALAFGEYSNIRHASDILLMLLMQSGSTIVSEGRQYQVTINESESQGLRPGSAALSFYTQFALPSNSKYTWNRALPLDRLEFLAGDLAIYFAPGSSYNDLQRDNPNLNFDIANVPQGVDATIFRNYGQFYAFAIPQSASNASGALNAAFFLSQPVVARELATALDLAPVHRSVINASTLDPYQRVLYDSALVSRGWLNPDPMLSEPVFQRMIEDVTSGRKNIGDAVDDTISRLRGLF